MSVFKQKGLTLTTLAIIGGGVAGLSLAFTLAKQKNCYSKVLLFDSDQFAPACALRSTAIVAPRGVSIGHSPLGDLIFEAFNSFKSHFENDQPTGVFSISQFTSGESKMEAFKARYPFGQNNNSASIVEFHQSHYLAKEDAYLIDPKIYLNWLKNQSMSKCSFINEFVTEINQEDLVKVTTHSGKSYFFDQVVLASGCYNQNWNGLTSVQLRSQKAQGAYLEFQDVKWDCPSFSLTFEGDNLIYHAHTNKLLVGSTTDLIGHSLPNQKELKHIHTRLTKVIKNTLPDISLGRVLVGHREKPPKRMPYLTQQNKIWFIGGLYKNGYSFSIHLAQKLAQCLIHNT